MDESKINENVTQHLEFLGYKLQQLTPPQDGYMYIAQSQSKGNILVRIFKNATILSIRYRGVDPKAVKSREFHSIMNQVNQEVMSKWYYQEDEKNEDITIVIEADYYDYDRTTFGAFVDQLNNEDTTSITRFKRFFLDNR